MLTRRVSDVLAAVLLVVGCDSEATLPPPSTPVHSASPVAPAPPDALVLPGGGANAPWLEAPVARGEWLPALFSDREVVSHGEHAAIVSTPAAGFFAAHERTGVVGPLAVPAGTLFVRLDGKDRVYAATKDGKLFAAASVTAAVSPGGFSEVGSVHGAVAWDAGKDLVAAAKGPNVVVSKDGGKTWKTTTPARVDPRGAARPIATPDIDDVLVRGDGVLAAHDADGDIFTSADGGATWHGFSMQTRVLSQEGAMVFVGLKECPIILSRDGVTWGAGDLAALFAGRAAWEGLFESGLGPVAHAQRPLITASDPKPPPRPKEPFTSDRMGSCSGTATGRGIVPTFTRGKECAGAFCLERAFGSAPVGHTRFELFEDGLCDAREADPSSFECKPGATLTRQPTMVLGDPVKKTARALPLPAGCRFESMFETAGAALILCSEVGSKAGPAPEKPAVAAASTLIYMLDAAGRFHAEGSLGTSASAFSRLTSASDGTVLLHCGPERTGCKNWLRAPRALGEAAAWRIVDVPSARLYHPWLGGTVLAFTAESEAAFSLVLDRADAPPSLLVRDVRVADIGRITGVSLENANVILEASKGDAPVTRFVVTAQGALAPK